MREVFKISLVNYKDELVSRVIYKNDALTPDIFTLPIMVPFTINGLSHIVIEKIKIKEDEKCE